MTEPQTVADIQRLIDTLDEHMVGLRKLLAEGEKIREALLKQQMALVWEEGGNTDIVRIVRNDP